MRRLGFIFLFAALAVAGLSWWLAGCASNDPFDPASVANQPPTIRFFVGPVEPGADLNATSYFQRHFTWSGTDPDGWITEYHVSIREHSEEPAPWLTTTRTDTTMTFITGEDGTSEATFLLACRDNRGAVSDTLVQFVPLRNFPPVVNFQSDFEPLVNLQREFVTVGEAVVDTLYWNWGACNFRLFALDLDGARTMDDYFTWTIAEGDPQLVVDYDDPSADPNTAWIRQPFPDLASEVREFEILVKDAQPGHRTLRVQVKDEAAGEAEFTYDWEVRAPRGQVLYIFDNTSSLGRAFYQGFFNDTFGADGWDSYNFWFGFPDRPYVLLETLRQFDLVIWTDGGSNSNVLITSAQRDGVLQQYVQGAGGAAPGKFMLITRAIAGSSSRLPQYFLQTVLGISPTPAPGVAFGNIVGRQALGQYAHLDAMTVQNTGTVGLGIVPLTGSEALFKMEYCETCYGDPLRPRPPYDPVIAVRRPLKSTAPFADVVSVSVSLEQFVPAEAAAALGALLTEELGVGQ